MSLQPSLQNIEWCNQRKIQEQLEQTALQRRGKLIEGMAFTTPEEVVEWAYSQERGFKEAEEKSKYDANLRGWLMSVRTPQRLEQIKKCKEYLATLENPPVYNPPPKKEEKPQNYEAEFWERMRAPLNPGSASPALTTTPSHERSVQWIQGNRIIMRPQDREILPGSRMTSVKIINNK